MIIGLSETTLLETFLESYDIGNALVLKGPLRERDLVTLKEQLDVVTLVKGDYVILVDLPIGSYDNLHGWLWINNKLLAV